jgi:uncharacterized protein YbjT (DUF2867 family)
MAFGKKGASMRILVTGSSGWPGQTLVPRLRRDGHHVVRLDPVPGAATDIAGSMVERETVWRRGWTMFQSIDRVYDATRAFERMGFACRTGFAERLAELGC